MVEYFGSDFIEKDVKTIPGSNNIIQTLEEMKTKLKKDLPQSYSLSLWMTNYLLKENSRQELILPKSPKEEASYWLGFGNPDSYQLKDSLLVRITDRPQSFMGITNHTEIGEIVQELRKSYDGKKIKRVETTLRIPTRDWSLHKSFRAEPKTVSVFVVYPQGKINIATDFEEILRKHDALDSLSRDGYIDLFKRVDTEETLIRTIT